MVVFQAFLCFYIALPIIVPSTYIRTSLDLLTKKNTFELLIYSSKEIISNSFSQTSWVIEVSPNHCNLHWVWFCTNGFISFQVPVSRNEERHILPHTWKPFFWILSLTSHQGYSSHQFTLCLKGIVWEVSYVLLCTVLCQKLMPVRLSCTAICIKLAWSLEGHPNRKRGVLPSLHPSRYIKKNIVYMYIRTQYQLYLQILLLHMARTERTLVKPPLKLSWEGLPSPC